MELETILRSHAGRYPLMEPVDAVKLLYQNEFGGGHLIRDEESCREYLRREWAATAKDGKSPLWEPIGGGMVRVNLAALEDTAWLEDAFLQSARQRRGDMASFLKKLELLRTVAKEGIFRFSFAALEAYLAEYQAEGCPMVSHSDNYRSAYHPAYRVILEEYLPVR